jgi:hypothetical protein
MRAAFAFVVVLSAAPAHADDETDRAAAELAAAIRARDAGAIARHLTAPLHTAGMYFPDAACSRRFGGAGEVRASEVPAFAKCLAGVKLQVTTRHSAMEDGAVLTVDPGVEVELAFDGGRVRWVGYLTQNGVGDGMPTLTAQAFEGLRKTGTTNLDAAVRGKLDPLADRAHVPLAAWLKVCLDARGAVTTVTAPWSSQPGVGEAFIAAVADWTFRPFAPRGAATPACSLTLLTYPADKAPAVEVLPLAAGVPGKSQDDFEIELKEIDDTDLLQPTPPPPPQTIAPTQLESLRIQGNKVIAPDAATIKQMQRDGKAKVVTSYKLCVSENGLVTNVSSLKGSGYPSYDQKIEREMRAWAYRPYVVNGKQTAVCTAVTFIYSP